MLRRVLLLGACASLCGCDFDRDLKNWRSEDAGVFDAGLDAGADAGTDAGFDGGLDAGTDAGSDGGWEFAPDGSYNFAFVTSVQVVANQFGNAASADALCGAFAAQAGLPGRYAAWITDQFQNTFDRTGVYRARGWLRPDGKPFADTPADLAIGHLLYPLTVDEHGHDIGFDVVLTGTYLDGSQGWNCSDFTGQNQFLTGCVGTAGQRWTDCIDNPCPVPARLACMGVDQARAIDPLPRNGRLVFVSTPWTPGGGIASADAWCNAEGASLDAGTFIAFLATSAVPASSRLVSDGGWMRVDGVEVGDLRLGTLLSPFEIFLDGGMVSETTVVFTGNSDPNATGDPSMSCNDWFGLDAGAFSSLVIGSPLIRFSWYSYGGQGDCGPHPVYCVQP
ncbi:MAG: hypothetical protein QM723_31630 [Myxococcaceae bacterium]